MSVSLGMNSAKEIKDVEIEYKKVSLTLQDYFYQIQNESYLNESLKAMKIYLNQNYSEKIAQSNQTAKEPVPMIQEYQAISKELEDKESLIDDKEEEEKLLAKEAEIKDEIKEMKEKCDKLLDEIINFDDQELRLLREQKQRRKLAFAKKKHRN